MRSQRLLGAISIITLAALVGVGLWKTGGGPGRRRVGVVRSVDGLMGTDASAAAVVAPGREREAGPLLAEAEQSLRHAEARLSTWLDDSELGRFHAAAPRRHVLLSPETVELLRLAQQAYLDTDGAFDAACRPVVELWREAGRRSRLPSEEELAAARAASSWDLIELTDDGAVRFRDTVRIDLGGIAKGYAIDRAIEVLCQASIEGGMVDVGGDLACFGRPVSGESWNVDVRNPFGPGVLARLRITGGAVCTSGDYARFVEIEGARYSHILDPRTGRPVEAVRSVTVVAPTAVVADVWATALSVLGVQGFRRMPRSAEAMIVEGDAGDRRLRCTPGFRALLMEPAPEGVEIVDAAGGS